MEWNAAVSRLHRALDIDPAVQGVEIEGGSVPRVCLIVVLEPAQSLSASSRQEVEVAQATVPVRVVDGRVPKAELERARRAIDAAAQDASLPPDSNGLGISTEWRAGKVRLTGDVASGEAIVGRANVDRDLVIIEGGPAIRRGRG